jgi:hypothetical protein
MENFHLTVSLLEDLMHKENNFDAFTFFKNLDADMTKRLIDLYDNYASLNRDAIAAYQVLFRAVCNKYGLDVDNHKVAHRYQYHFSFVLSHICDLTDAPHQHIDFLTKRYKPSK